MVHDYDAFVADLARRQAGEIDASRLELALWSLVRGDQRAEARTRRHPLGIELLLLIDGEIVSSQAFGASTVHRLEASAETIRCTLEADGWLQAGPRPE